MATLSTPTGTEIVSIFTGGAGSVPVIGSYNAAAIDAEIAALTPSSVAELELARMNLELDSSGLNSSNLTTAEYNAAWIALLWACVYQYRVKDRIQRLASGQECEVEESYRMAMEAIRNTICGYLFQIGARSSYYCGYNAEDTPTLIKNGELVDFSAPSQFNSITEA